MVAVDDTTALVSLASSASGVVSFLGLSFVSFSSSFSSCSSLLVGAASTSSSLIGASVTAASSS